MVPIDGGNESMADRSKRAKTSWEPVRAELIARRRQLINQVARVEDDLRWFETNVEPEQLEEGQEQALAGVLERLEEHDRAEITAIERALARMDRGEYGVCRACGEAIPAARQRALPTADLCRPCADRQQR
jgi:RNA polymerase-binding transcription factor DksA